VKKGKNQFAYLIPILIVVVFAGLYLYKISQPPETLPYSQYENANDIAVNQHNDPVQQKNNSIQSARQESPPVVSSLVTQNSPDSAKQNLQSIEKNDTPATSESHYSPSITDESPIASVETLRSVVPAQSEQCLPLINKINTFYAQLDRQPYMKTFHLDEPSKEYFSKLIQTLINNPPIVTRETDDLFTLLKNTAHFFRILGKKNILILKGILDREKDSLESILSTFYALSIYPECLEKEYSLTLPLDALYDYAGFFLNTMGGRLYLFRRDSTSRMIVSYYAIMIIDRANIEGSDKHGIDLLPSVNALIEEIETGGKRIQKREIFLDNLYDLKEKYDR
jgi:hypothetical protein